MYSGVFEYLYKYTDRKTVITSLSMPRTAVVNSTTERSSVLLSRYIPLHYRGTVPMTLVQICETTV